MQATVFMAMSLDGFIAGLDGDVSWLDQCGVPDAPMGDAADMGFFSLMRRVDCLVLGRGTAEKLASFQLTTEQWPYGDTPIYIVSNSLAAVPVALAGKASLLRGALADVVAQLEHLGHQQLYVDGGALVRSFIDAGLVQRLVITVAPVLLGQGIALFAGLTKSVKLRQLSATRYANEFVQLEYAIAPTPPHQDTANVASAGHDGAALDTAAFNTAALGSAGPDSSEQADA